MEKPTFTAQKRNEPDWFRIGRDAVHVMERLGGMKELDFYLRHPEPFIRLQAIRRVAALLLPDAVPTLAKMLEDPLENEQNRDEAGWAIRRITRAKGLAWFAKTPWTDRYDGTEPPASRYGVTLAPSGTSPEPVYEAAGTEDARLEDEVLLRIQMEEKELRVEFSPLPWLARNGRWLLKAVLLGIVHGIVFVFTRIGRLFAFLGRQAAQALRTARARQSARRKAQSDADASTGAAALSLQTTDLPEAPTAAAAVNGTTQRGADTDGVAGRIAGIADNANRPVFLIGAREAGYPESAQPAIPARGEAPAAARGEASIQSRTEPPAAIRGSSTIQTAPRSAAPLPTTATIHPGRFAGLRRNHPSHRSSRYAGRGGNPMFKLLFYPVRLVRQHWVFTLLVLFLFYFLLAFSHAGRTFVHTINPRVLRDNDRLVAVIRVGVLDFFGITPSPAAPEATASASASESAGTTVAATSAGTVAQTEFRRVSAPKGLNLRESPSASGTRIVWMPLDAQVTVLGETRTDAAGDLWQSVSYRDATGWALDKWLAPVVAP